MSTCAIASCRCSVNPRVLSLWQPPVAVTPTQAMTQQVTSMGFGTINDYDVIKMTWTRKSSMGLKMKAATADKRGAEITAIDSVLPTDGKLTTTSKLYSANGQAPQSCVHKLITQQRSEVMTHSCPMWTGPHRLGVQQDTQVTEEQSSASGLGIFSPAHSREWAADARDSPR